AAPEPLRRLLEKDERVKAVGTRLLFTGLVHASGGSRGVLIIGVEPGIEKELSILPGYLTQGRYLGESPRDIFLGAKLAGEIDVRLGERIVVMAQSLQGDMGSELFRVAGLFEAGSAAYDGQIVYVPIDAARRLRGAGAAASHVVGILHDVGSAERLVVERSGDLRDPQAVLLTYKDVGSEIVGIKKFQDALLIVVLIIIFSIVGLGILNTISMSFFERIREFGVLRAIGARPVVVLRVLLAEASLMGLIGASGGLLLGLACIRFFGVYGLELPLGRAMAYFMPFDDRIYMQPQWAMHLKSAAGVYCVCVAAAVGPAVRAARLVVTEALRHI
ncbi:MAG: ABC transporter permease, partial [Bradyrhizobium sp.]|nr:ABC transporter permease [Bradyrhizobium sp.]